MNFFTERNQWILLGFITVMTLVNTILILTKDTERVIQRGTLHAPVPPPLPHADPNRPAPENVQTPSGPITTVEFINGEHDFGTVKQHSKNPHKFLFRNTGSNALLISEATASCGCTVPSYPKEPIPPGGTGEIEIMYSPGDQKGSQFKTVTVIANTDPPKMQLSIKADVVE